MTGGEHGADVVIGEGINGKIILLTVERGCGDFDIEDGHLSRILCAGIQQMTAFGIVDRKRMGSTEGMCADLARIGEDARCDVDGDGRDLMR